MLSLNDREWKPFLISDIYTYAKGNQNNMGSLSDGNIPLVSARKFDNGLKAFVDKNDKTIFQGNCISYNNDGNGGAGLSFFQPFDFYLDLQSRTIASVRVLYLVRAWIFGRYC